MSSNVTMMDVLVLRLAQLVGTVSWQEASPLAIQKHGEVGGFIEQED